MHFPTPETDLRGFRLSRINEPQFRHLWWLLFWPVYLLRYFLVEHWNPAQTYHVMHCFLDDWIPFQEGFIVFYASWYFLIVGVHLYTLLYDRDTFCRYSKFLCIGMSVSTVIFLVYPSCQQLRPAVFLGACAGGFCGGGGCRPYREAEKAPSVDAADGAGGSHLRLHHVPQAAFRL